MTAGTTRAYRGAPCGPSTIRPRRRPAATATCRTYRSDEFGNKKGFLHDHLFPAANTALPFMRGDRDTQKKIRDFLQNKVLTVDLFAVRRGDELDRARRRAGRRPAGRDARRRGRRAHARRRPPVHERDRGLQRDVGVARGRGRRGQFFASGVLDADGRLDPAADRLSTLVIDEDGELHGPPPAAGHPRAALQQRHRSRRGAGRALPRQDPRGRGGTDHAHAQARTIGSSRATTRPSRSARRTRRCR